MVDLIKFLKLFALQSSMMLKTVECSSRPPSAALKDQQVQDKRGMNAAEHSYIL